MVALVQTALVLLGLYLAMGVIVGIGFVARGVDRVDPSMRASPMFVRVLILPGTVTLWPLMLHKWMRASRQPGSDHA